METLPIEKMILHRDRKKKGISKPSERDRVMYRTLGINSLPRVVCDPRVTSEGEYQIVSNHRTWLIAQEMMEASIPVTWAPDDEQSIRRLVNAEYTSDSMAMLIREVISRLRHEKPGKIARELGIDRTLVWKFRQLEKLCDAGWKAMDEGTLPYSHALLLVMYDEFDQEDWIDVILKTKLSRRELSKRLAEDGDRPAHKLPAPRNVEKVDPNTVRLLGIVEQQIQFKHEYNAKRGTLTFYFDAADKEGFESLLTALSVDMSEM